MNAFIAISFYTRLAISTDIKVIKCWKYPFDKTKTTSLAWHKFWTNFRLLLFSGKFDDSMRENKNLEVKRLRH